MLFLKFLLCYCSCYESSKLTLIVHVSNKIETSFSNKMETSYDMTMAYSTLDVKEISASVLWTQLEPSCFTLLDYNWSDQCVVVENMHVSTYWGNPPATL